MSNWRSSLVKGLFYRLGAASCAWFALASPPALAAPQSPFVGATIGLFDGPGAEVTPEIFQSDTAGPLLVETGSLPAAYGKTRAEFGSNGFSYQVTGGIDREIDGGSIWTDGFVVTGGTGSGTLQMSSHIVGSVSGHAEMFHGLYVSDQPFDFQTILDTVAAGSGPWSLQFPNATRLFITGIANRCGQSRPMGDCANAPYVNFQGAFDLALTQGVPFTYGQTVYVASIFGGGVGTFGGSADFFNSATFGITAPAGSAVAALSGTAYAAAVPEPPAWALLLAGLAVAGVCSRRRRR